MDHCLRRDQQLPRSRIKLSLASQMSTNSIDRNDDGDKRLQSGHVEELRRASPSVREMVLHLQHSETPPLLAPASLRNGLCCY
ncbi:hypothetical protein YC2023_095614 [Brassica napus]